MNCKGRSVTERDKKMKSLLKFRGKIFPLSRFAPVLFTLAVFTVYTYFSGWCLCQQVDDMLVIAVMEKLPHTLSSFLFTRDWFYPYGVRLSDGFDLNIAPSIVGNLLFPVLGDWVLTQRVTAALFLLATALSMYYAVRSVYGDAYGAGIGATAFAFSNYFVMRTPSHLSLLGGFVFPLGMICLVKKKSLCLGLVMGLAYWCSPFYGLALPMLAALYGVYELLTGEQKARDVAKRYVFSIALLMLMILPFIPSSSKRHEYYMCNTVTDLLLRHERALIASSSSSGNWEATAAYLGLSTVVLAAVSSLRRRRERFTWFLVSVALIFAVLSFSPIPLFPFDSFRATARFAVVSLFVLSFLSGGTFSGLRINRMKRVPLAGVALVAIVVDTLVVAPPWFTGPPPFHWDDPGYSVIRGDESAVAQIHFPIMVSDVGLMYYQYYGVLTGKKVVDAQTSALYRHELMDSTYWNIFFLRQFLVSDTINKFALEYAESAFKELPSSLDFWTLRSWGVDYIVLHRFLYGPIGRTEEAIEYLNKIENLGWISQVYISDQISIYKVTIS